MHFGCLLISEDNSEDAIYEEMDKYSEYSEKYLKLEDYTDEVIEEYIEKINEIEKNNGKFSFEIKDFLKKYPSLSDYAYKEFGYETYEIENGEKYGYLSNPNSFYDWYEIGGRWKITLSNKNNEVITSFKLKDLNFEETGFIKYFSEIWDKLYDENYICKKKEEKNDFEYYKRIIESEQLTKEDFIDKYKDYNLSGIQYIVWPEDYKIFDTPKKEPLIEKLKELQKEYPEYYITVLDCHV
ncbi:hypothetical protein [Fusobacterium periodonticum]|uniref:Uncharacterized protein n=1 Tax=Fusobacterium periodonticum ATCC 33693 TaxID=546275 RepID=D4CXJ4_9FUSO|nr:hypothetical protein [Fusobacterium periodonticum]EFE86114.1 hypothetical protein FUSPEROL_02155 [Fusobacterium periodonticum ATCC 33693]